MQAGLAGLFCMGENSIIRNALLAVMCTLALLVAHAAAADPQKPASKSSPKAATGSSTKTSAHKRKHTRSKATRSSRRRGQKAIDSERTRQIQEALIREHYLSGSPSGKWDDATQAAMRHYQSDQGWQAKTVPDSRALIKLGLGPSNDHLLNPESAMTAAPAGANAPGNPPRPASEPSAPQ